MEAFSTGTLAGAGSFHCEQCGYVVALQERDEIPDCPHCGARRFKRSSIFGEHRRARPWGHEVEHPAWLDDARQALVAEGDYLAWEEEDRVRVVPLEEDWTRIGRSMAAHIRFDDPTVSRRHALLHREDGRARILDDRSLNGVFLNGDRIDWSALQDGDEIAVGRFRLYFMSLTGDVSSAERTGVGSAVG
jgi:pSer/pThr/pTyr-binding forkhead associated (FHA) protein